MFNDSTNYGCLGLQSRQTAFSATHALLQLAVNYVSPISVTCFQHSTLLFQLNFNGVLTHPSIGINKKTFYRANKGCITPDRIKKSLVLSSSAVDATPMAPCFIGRVFAHESFKAAIAYSIIYLSAIHKKPQIFWHPHVLYRVNGSPNIIYGPPRVDQTAKITRSHGTNCHVWSIAEQFCTSLGLATDASVGYAESITKRTRASVARLRRGPELCGLACWPFLLKDYSA